ncbi:hypothetical protein MSAN_01437200 [Mycena sanguinolenta]|uniref:acetyl-CoA C-acetyltransferase n=1 Tax=Mycena sanguinolenta TaxID=230812 RepID=A0A8H6YA33_9AGAR|nr:hypothetical protein MSAN_01437200 [Mycena sanguinolenta]
MLRPEFSAARKRSGYGYMTRSCEHTRRTAPVADASDNDGDDATAPAPAETLTCKQYIVYSATFQVPAFYFTLHDAGGSPLALDDLVRTTLFHRFAFEGTESTSFGLACDPGRVMYATEGSSRINIIFSPVLASDVDVVATNFIPLLPVSLAQWLVPSSQSPVAGSKIVPLQVHEAVIVAASRTPVGSLNGNLKSFTATQLGTAALKHALESRKIDPKIVEELYFGNVVQAGVGQSPARQVALNAGLSTSSDATTINKVCASGMKSVMLAAQSIQLGERSVVAAGGMESMSNAPFLIPRQNPAFGKFTAIDSLENDAVHLRTSTLSSPTAAQNAHGQPMPLLLKSRLSPVKGKKGDTIVKEDEEYKRVIYEKVPSLKSAFKQGGSITAANSSPLNDGASALVLMSAEKAKELGIKPLAKIISYADAGVEPIDFPIAPPPSHFPRPSRKPTSLSMTFALFEINEAFSVVVRIAEKVMKIDPAKINVNGGAVALGHAIGSSGSRIVVSLVHALKSGEYGAAGVCNGGGAASAIVIQKL